jgi:predicted ATPase/class 3 adenylate cyclase
MASTPSIIQGNTLTYQQNGQPAQLMVDTSDWYAWLQTASTFTFCSEHGTFTARKERAGNKRGGPYWRAYRKHNGKLHRAYLGKSGELTFERLSEVAARLVGQRPADDEVKANTHERGETTLWISKETQDGQASLPSAPTSDFAHSNEHVRKRSSRRDLPTGTITLLFSDIEGSTRLLQRLGDHYASVLADCRHLLRMVFAHYNGHEVDTQGDAFFVAFARATDAISAAVALQRALAGHLWPQDIAVRVRIGIHTGEPLVTVDGYIGVDVHHAARIMNAGHGGQILLSHTTHGLVEQYLPEDTYVRDLGEHRLKDLQRPSHLFQLCVVELPADFPPLKTLDASPNNLPLQPTPFIGREKELPTVGHLLRRPEVCLVTLTGTGGVGKTRLGLRVATDLLDDFASGVYFVPLAPISDPDLVVPTIAQALGIQEAGDRPLLEQLQEYLRDRHLLLLLDNFEQVLAAAPRLSDLLSGCPHLKILVTSRAVLHIRGEHEFPVPPLALPDCAHLPESEALSQYASVALFLERARAAKPDFQLTPAKAHAIAEICVRLDGLPLALELAAARIKLLPPQALLKRLEHRLEVLTSGAQDLPARQQTLRNTLQWSYDLLSAEERRLFRQLSVFVGGCTLEAAATVVQAAGDTGDGGSNQAIDVLEEVASLLDKSLLQQTEWEGEEPRLLMLETIREFGLECLQACGELEPARRAHAFYYLAIAEEANRHLFSAEAVMWFERLEREYENLRAALEWALEHEAEEAGSGIEVGVRLGSALWRFWTVRSHLSEGRAMLERLLVASERNEASVREKVLLALGTLLWHQGDYARIGEIVEEQLSLCQQLGDQQGVAHTLIGLAGFAAQQGNYARARSLAEESLAICRANGDTWRAAANLLLLGRMASARGEHARAQQLLEESRVLYRALGYAGDIAWPLIYLARNAIFQGEHEQARSWLEEAQALVYLAAGNKVGLAHALSLLGKEALEQGDVVRAYDLLTECHLLNQEAGNRRNIAHSLFLLASVITQQGDSSRAYALYEQSLALARTLEHRGLIASCLEGLAVVVSAQGQPTRAAQLWGAAETVRETMGQRNISSFPQTLHIHAEQARAMTRTYLGDEAFVRAFAEGRTMTSDQILSLQEPVVIIPPLGSK